MKKLPPLSYAILPAAVFGAILVTFAGAGAGDLNLQAKLIWGTNGGKPNDPSLKEVDPKTAEKLAGVFRWKSYYEVSRTNFTVAAATTKTVRMSPKCDVKVNNQGKSQLEVELYGKGKMVVRKRQQLALGELLVLAGDDKNDTAWFVIMNLNDR